MDMSSSSNSSDCSVTMLWNWSTIDSCFLAPSWHVKTAGQFAVSCIGVAFLVIVLEFLRRLGKEYEDSIQRQFQRHVAAQSAHEKMQLFCGDSIDSTPTIVTFQASPMQQMIRALIHTLQFGLAYIIMLIAMYYNGYMIISIFLGAFFGKAFCDWGQYRVVVPRPASPTAAPDAAAGMAGEKPMECCG
ncbi:Ctr-domain-containing protein [Aspergillus heteromorphus CBS 117.55]|uniref:Copper transport protein n=1 Tax=Aspergillus heteromorphus CBS 117.55 TaxID=1448321 RepID=A0A317W9U7_9EURO|nr:Ctr-domain-containing protein [Aspergillus heteromorphus CBS 117.55]PWY83356.1 Ctr-domain-containing protein [Aspergillus heteromorphus CBS 117.55]